MCKILEKVSFNYILKRAFLLALKNFSLAFTHGFPEFLPKQSLHLHLSLPQILSTEEKEIPRSYLFYRVKSSLSYREKKACLSYELEKMPGISTFETFVSKQPERVGMTQTERKAGFSKNLHQEPVSPPLSSNKQ